MKKEYPIPAHLARPILDYIVATQNVYQSDIDVLFCKTSQFAKLTIPHENDNHYTYANLRQCLSYFYRDIIQKKYRYDIVSERDNLADYEIEKIHLGDTRHIAMIALAVSGGSPTICRELAGHDSIAISAHYYTNLTTFLDVLGYERYRNAKADVSKAYGLAVSQQWPVADGFCQCQQVWNGDYSPCVSAVNADGIPGSCAVCKWYFPQRMRFTASKTNAAMELQQTCTLLKQALDQLRQGLGNADTVSCVLDRLSAQARQYAQASAIERMFAEREEL